MKRALILFVLALFLLPSILALDLELEKLSKGEVMIAGMDNPVDFNFRITNLGGDTRLEFFNLLSFNMAPVEKISINASETKEIKISLWPIGKFDHMGQYTLTYFIKADDGTQIQRTLTFRRIELKEALSIGASSFDSDASSVTVYIENKENFNFGSIEAKFSSAFFNFDEKFDLGPKEKKEFTISIDKEDFKQLLAGFYLMNVDVTADEARASLSTNLEFKEKGNIKTEELGYGLIIRTDQIKKINEGNIVSDAKIEISKNMISRLFTTFSPDPDVVDRSGAVIYYTWSKSLKPGEDFIVNVKTNWVFPLILIILVIAIVVLTKQYTSSNLVLRKKVSFVNAKGGEFALKVSIHIHARKYMENINIIDRLPPLVKIYERFGATQPTKVDEKLKRISWAFDKLEAGEMRMVSYIIYSKVGVMGKFSLPSTKGIYEIGGQIHETTSNRAFFISEPRGVKDLEQE